MAKARRPPPKSAARKRNRSTKPETNPSELPETHQSKNGSYEVGYGQTPEHTRFKKGQSGNPKGRPKGAKGFKTILRKELLRTISVTEQGKSRKMSTFKVVLRKLSNDAMMGKPHAVKQIMEYCQQFLDEDSAAATEQILTESEQQLLRLFLEDHQVTKEKK